MLLYRLVIVYIKIGLFFFYKKITVTGIDNIPRNNPILFVANHQNAMMDPLIVATTTSKTMYFLARASAFKNKVAAKLLTELQAIAIYRVRDGVDSKHLNQSVFSNCLDLLNNNNNILIFPEGSHSIKRQVRSLRAGFTQITINFLNNNPNKDLVIIPVGLNYCNTINYAKSVHVIYGKPIKARQFLNDTNLNKSKFNLINEVHKALKKITIHIDDENYDTQIKTYTEEDFLFFGKFKKSKINSKSQSFGARKSSKINFFYYLMMLNSIFPFLIWRWMKPKVKSVEFVSTAKFSLGLTVFPLFYILQTTIVSICFGNIYALIYIILSIILVFLSTKTR